MGICRSTGRGCVVNMLERNRVTIFRDTLECICSILTYHPFHHLTSFFFTELIKYIFHSLTAVRDNWKQHRWLRIKQRFPNLLTIFTAFSESSHNFYISPHPNPHNFTGFSNMFWLRREGSTCREGSKHIRNRVRASGRPHLQYIRSTPETDKGRKS